MKRKSVLILCLICATALSGCGSSSSKGMVSSAPTEGFALTDMAAESAMTNDAYYEYEEGFYYEDFNTEEYNYIKENGFVKVVDNPLSTFAADVDTGSYCNLRRIIRAGWDIENISSAIRTEEIINYFDYDVPNNGDIFNVKAELSACPWNESNDLLIMTLQADTDVNVPSKGNNFVFLIDVSGSMDSSDKITMVNKSFKLLASTLSSEDRVSVVTYSGDDATLLEGSNNYREICKALDEAEKYCKNYGGGTNGSGGIEAAYRCAKANFIEGGNNRVIIASDGDMNLGVTSQGGLVDLITEKKETGVFLTVLGYGTGNYSDANMESIADAGNGNYYYIDNIDEAERVLVDKLKQTTVTVAKDVKFQAEFNPAVVESYRQIGYENRQMSASDFSDDTKDGGEVGAGQQVTVVYEIDYVDENTQSGGLKYQEQVLSENANSGDILTLSVRYKDPTANRSQLLSYAINPDVTCVTSDFDFIAGIIEASMVLRNSDYLGTGNMNEAYMLVDSGATDKYRKEFHSLLKELDARKTDNVLYANKHDAKSPIVVEKSEPVIDDDPVVSEVHPFNFECSYVISYDKLSDVIDTVESLNGIEGYDISKQDGVIFLTVTFESDTASDDFIGNMVKLLPGIEIDDITSTVID